MGECFGEMSKKEQRFVFKTIARHFIIYKTWTMAGLLQVYLLRQESRRRRVIKRQK